MNMKFNVQLFITRRKQKGNDHKYGTGINFRNLKKKKSNKNR